MQIIFERLIAAEGQKLVGWRAVPQLADDADIGPTARDGEPRIEQVIIAAAPGLTPDAFERKLYLIRKQASHALRGDEKLKQRKLFYICSLSTNTLIYKGMLTQSQVGVYYSDLTDRISRLTSRWALEIFYQYIPKLGSCSTASVHESQRRNQH